ncbi:MAG: aminotransferase class I/II-fold pyridoxal phosphate-dependent enzyme, partial [Planctomycetaceae bacterium]
DIMESVEFMRLSGLLARNIRLLVEGLAERGISCLGGGTPIVTVLVGDEEDALRAGKTLFDLGYYVQSVTFPAVEYHRAVLRLQVNSNHRESDVQGLAESVASALGKLHEKKRAA